ncbi:OmpA family protein [Winogradskyella sp. PE311]|uniref:OmpA family protein n=1 Tax=Winogradskyella sp. PE311 TaxID=3366943 RepID=UPI00397F96AD
MKNITKIIIVLLVSFSYGQTKNTKADKLFDRLWYKEAAELYEKELKKEKNYSLELLKRAGDSYYFNTDMENAYKWYDVLISNYGDEVESEYIFRYSHSLQGIGDYRQAKRWMKEFSKRTKSEDNRVEHFNQENQSIEDVLNIEGEFTLKNVKVNTEYSDFGVQYYKDQLVYSSAVDSSNFHTRIYHWNEQPFLNMYLGKLNTLESNVSKIEEFSDKLNTRYHEATLAFSPDYKTVYFTRNNYNGDLGRDNDGTNHLKLYSAQVRNDKEKDSSYNWYNVKELPFNSENYSVGHPTISEDGKLLYFVSDMPGTIGATDIFVVDILEYNNDKEMDSTGYSQPRNLGAVVNTPGREMFPYIAGNELYFASDGHLGLGGLDVFHSSKESEVFSNPINLGSPLNSKLDDFNFIIKEDLNTGFVCSNRSGGKGDDDIYSFIRVPRPEDICEQKVRGYVSNTITGERIANVALVLFDANNTQIEETTSDLNGAYKFNTIVDCDAPHQVKANKTGYAPKQKDFKTLDETGETVVALGIETVNELIVEEGGLLKIKIGIIYFDLDKSYIRKNDAAIELNKIVLLMNEYPNMVIQIESHTDTRNSDSYNMALSDRRAKSTREYIIAQGISADRIDSAKGFGESQLINRCSNGVPCSESEHQMNRRSEFIIVKM